MERASRLTVSASIVLAAMAHAWLAQSPPAVSAAALAAFAATFVLARWSDAAGMAVVAATTYVAPALLTAAFNAFDYHVMIVWLAAALGPIFACVDHQHWHYPRRWRTPLVGWALVVALSWPIVAGREVEFSLVVARSHDAANGIALTSPPLAAAFVIMVALTQLLTLLWMDLLWARLRTQDAPIVRTLAVPFLIGIVASSCVGIYQRLVDLQFMNLPFWSNLGRAGGLLNDANTFGMGTALWAPIALVAGWSVGRPFAGLLTYIVLAMGMWSTGSRTALMALAAGSVAAGIAVLQRRGIWDPRIGRIVGLLAVALFILAAAVLPRDFEGGNPLKRAFDRVPRLESAEIRRFVVEDLWTRFGYGQAAVDIVRDYPVAGVGIGAFHVVAPEYIYRRTGRQVAQDNAQNWWRHQIAELGIAGSLPSLWASGLVLLLLRGERDVRHDGAITVLRGVVLGIGIASLLGVPTQHPATALSFATLVVWLSGLATPQSATSPDRPGRSWLFGGALAAVLVIALAATARNGLSPRARTDESNSPYAHGFSRPEGTSEFGELRWAAADAVSASRSMYPWLQLTMWAPYSNVEERNIRAVVRINGKPYLSHQFTTADAETYFLEVPRDADRVTVEINTSGAVPPERAIQTAMMWRHAPARSAPPDRVLR